MRKLLENACSDGFSIQKAFRYLLLHGLWIRGQSLLMLSIQILFYRTKQFCESSRAEELFPDFGVMVSMLTDCLRGFFRNDAVSDYAG